jgi:hypothetical protein
MRGTIFFSRATLVDVRVHIFLCASKCRIQIYFRGISLSSLPAGTQHQLFAGLNKCVIAGLNAQFDEHYYWWQDKAIPSEEIVW